MKAFVCKLATWFTLALLCLLWSPPLPARVIAQSPDIRGPFVGPTASAASFDGDVRRLPSLPPTPHPMRNEVDDEDRVWGALTTDAPDAARQTMSAPSAMPATMQNFKGLNYNDNGDGFPPDTNGDVGPNHYIQTVNASIGIYNKSGTQLAAFTFDAFFAGTGTPCDNANGGDPVVLYDPPTDRWIVTDFAWADIVNGPFYECIAVSKTGDPVNGGWWLYGYEDHATLFPDYPKLGVWSDGIYMSVNLFDSGGIFQGVRVYAFDRNRLINGLSLNNTIYFDGSSSYSSLLPSNYRGFSPPSGEPNFFMARSSPSTLRLCKFHTDFATPANATFTGPTNMTATSWAIAGSVPELSGNSLDSLSSRLMMQNQYRRNGDTESLFLNHTVSSGGVAGVRWYEIRDPNGAPSIYQQSTYQPDSTYRWMGSIAADHQGNVAIGFSASSSSMFPAIRYAGRLVGDSLSTLGQGEATIINSTGAQTGNVCCPTQPNSRWGDYSAMSVDPVDDCTFWYTTEYYEATGNNWQTRIASFKYASCTPITRVYLPVILR